MTIKPENMPDIAIDKDRSVRKMTDQELKQLAMDCYQNKIFTSGHIPEHDLHLLPNIFMVLALMEEPLPPDTAMVYEYMDKAGTMGFNGYPMFMSCHIMNKEDARYFHEQYKLVKAQIDSFLTSDKD